MSLETILACHDARMSIGSDALGQVTDLTVQKKRVHFATAPPLRVRSRVLLHVVLRAALQSSSHLHLGIEAFVQHLTSALPLGGVESANGREGMFPLMFG